MSKIKKFLFKYSSVIIDILYYIYFIIAIGVKIFYFQYTTEINVNEAAYIDSNLNTMRAAISIILLIFSIVFLVFKKRRNGALFVVNVLLSILFLADTLYFRYYQTPLTVSLIYMIKVVGDVTGSVGSLYKIKDIVYFIDLPVYLIVFIIKKLLAKKNPTIVIKRSYAFISSIIIIVASMFIFMGCFAKANTSLHTYDRTYAAKDLSILYYHYFDIKSFAHDEIQRRQALTDEEEKLVNEFYNNKNNNRVVNDKYAGIAKDRNLIVIQVEALQKFVIENTINGEEVTPFLNSLIKDSFYFDNIYHQVAGGNTSDAEFISNNSLYPIGSGAVYFRYPNNTYHSLPKELIKQDYNTYVSHAYKPSFWNRQNFYQNAGFEKFFSLNDYVLDEKVGWAVSDKSFFRQTFEKIDTNNKFYSFNVTLSSHHPYDAFTGSDILDVGKYQGKQLGCYLKAARYDDMALQSLFDELKAKGLYDNSIIVIYGDHSAIFEDQKTDLCDYLGLQYNEFNWKKLQQVPVIIHVPNQAATERVSKVGGQIDILPTVAHLMGLNMPYTMGKNMLDLPNNEGYAVLRYSSVITDNYMYISDSSTYYDINTGEVIDPSIYSEDLHQKLLQLRISDIIINKDYFHKIEK